MKITFSPLIAGASGRAADAVMSSWHGRAFVRKHVIPHNPRSIAQVAQRMKLARIPPWWRSLPDAIKGSAAMKLAGTFGLLEIIAKAFNLPAYSVFGKYNLQLLSDDEPPIIIPGNPSANTLGSITADAQPLPSEIMLAWTPGAAIATHFVHLFSAPVDPLEADLEEPDVFTYAGTPQLVSAASGAIADLANEAKLYYVVALVADSDDLATATVLSGGIAITATSGAA
jgi:hypothetical protein